MAEKRFLSRRITESDKMRHLANERRYLATTLYQWLLPYTDRAGRHNANAYYLKGGIFQGYEFTLEELDAAIDDLARVGLVRLYSNGKHDRLIQYTKFTVDEGGFNKPHEREAASTLPGPDDAESKEIVPPPLDRNPGAKASRTSPGQGHGQVTDKVRDDATAKARQRRDELKVEIELELKTEVEKEHSSTAELASRPAPPALAAAPPRESHDPWSFVEAWNANRGRLPGVTALSGKRRGAIRALVKEHGATAALDLFRDATLAVAHDDFWTSRQYGFDTLLAGNKVLARAEQWRAGAKHLGDANMRLATTALAVANAIGGLDDQPN